MFIEFISTYHDLIEALHIISVIAWMAGMLYLPRLYVYHCDAVPGGEADLMLQTMERRLLRIIVNPAMILTFVFGTCLVIGLGSGIMAGWLHIKFVLVFLMAGVHGMFARWRKHFAKGQNRHSRRFYTLMNEVPALIMIVIVLFVVCKPLLWWE